MKRKNNENSDKRFILPVENLGDGMVLCPNCGGTGYLSLQAPVFEPEDDFMNPDVCLVCNGYGNVPASRLPEILREI